MWSLARGETRCMLCAVEAVLLQGSTSIDEYEAIAVMFSKGGAPIVLMQAVQ